MQQEEFESPTSRFVAECSIQLSYCCIYRKYYKIHLQHFHLKYIFKGNFRGKLTRKSLKPFNTNNFEIECVRFVAEHFIQLSYWCILLYYTCFFCILQEIFNILVEVFLCFRVNNNFFLKTFRKFIKCLANLSFLCYIILVI